jgi:ferric-dicitrate binding protein FerR (iron transport regulator)
MESNKDRDFLISRYLENKCTSEEEHQLYEMLVSSDNERSFKDVIFSHLDEFTDNKYENNLVDSERIFNQLLTEIKRRETFETEKKLHERRKNVRRLVYGVITIAAVFCFAFFLGHILDHITNTKSTVHSETSAYNEIKAPIGARSEIKLSDGTEVMLNAGSSLKYRNDYNLLNRDLILEGEGYFKVAKNTRLPLVVFAGNINIKAIGTEFNVKAYSDEGIIETTLVKGEVEISQKGNDSKNKILMLEPNQKAIYANKTDQLTLERIKEIEPLAVKPAKIITDKLLVSPKTDVEQATAWTKNKLIIRSENLESLCTKLQRKYDVNFIFKDEELKKQRFSGILIDETFQQVMDVIKLTAPVEYLLNGKTVIMALNKEQAEKYSKNQKRIKSKSEIIKN